jgi:hypothetical protein
MPACLSVYHCLSLRLIDEILPHQSLGQSPVDSPHLPDPDSTEALSGSKSLAEIYSKGPRICFYLSINAILFLSVAVAVGLKSLEDRMMFPHKMFLMGYLITSLSFHLIAYYSFDCRRSVLNENTALIKFVNNRFRSGVEDEGTPTTVKWSYWFPIVGYISAIFFTIVLHAAICGLVLTLGSIYGPLSSTVSNIFYFTLYAGGCLLGTSRILNMRTNFMIVVFVGLVALSLFVNTAIFSFYMYWLGDVSVRFLYRNYGCHELAQEVVSASGTVNASPVLVCETGTGSISETDETCEEKVISGATTFSISTSSPSNGAPSSREGFFASICGDSSRKSTEGAYSLLAADESVHGPDRSRSTLT